MPTLDRLQSEIGYTFSQVSLLETALTHASCSAYNNQRLEYLGDALLGFVISDLLYRRHTRVDEGALTRLRAHLVCKKTLGLMAKKLNLADFLRLGKSLEGADQPTESMYADAFEALIAAVYLDGGHMTVAQVVESCYRRFYADDFYAIVQKDAKTSLQEFCQRHRYALPDYQIVERAQEDNRFAATVSIDALQLTAESSASSKREAQRLAAARLLCQLQEKGLL